MAVAKLPEGPDWEYEIKFDGYRALGIKSGSRVRLISRNGNDFSARFPSIANALSKLPDDTIVDGEIVALDETGRPSFNVLQNYNHSATPLEFSVFDILHLAGENLRDRPLDDRRELLRAKLMPRMQGEIRFSETLKASAAEVVATVKKQGLEGVIAKRRDSLYEPGRRSGLNSRRLPPTWAFWGRQAVGIRHLGADGRLNGACGGRSRGWCRCALD